MEDILASIRRILSEDDAPADLASPRGSGQAPDMSRPPELPSQEWQRETHDVRPEHVHEPGHAASQDGLALFCEAWASSRLPVLGLDGLDERLARARRQAFGRRCCVLSWQRELDGSWRARLSGPDLEMTIERSARTRACAIFRSARVLRRIRAFRARLATCPDPDPDSRHAEAP